MPDASKVRVAVTGAVLKGATSATAPTGTASAPSGFLDLGFIGEDGVEINLPGAGDATPIKAWQNGTTVRVVRTPSEDNPTWGFVMLETTKETVETYFGVTVTQTATEGSFEYEVTNREHQSYIVDVVDAAELIRDYIPYGIVSEVGSHTLANGEAIGYEVTVEGERDPSKGFNFKRWATALKTTPVWAASTPYTVGNEVRLSTGEILEATVAGTSGATEPAPPAVDGTVTDGTVTWKRIA